MWSRTPNLLEAETNRALFLLTARLAPVANHFPYAVLFLSRIAGLDEIDVFISDRGLDADARAAIGEQVERIVIAPSRGIAGAA